ncbi:MAG: hypothetical protein Fur0010_24100 [Bdellovibrio sp.]
MISLIKWILSQLPFERFHNQEYKTFLNYEFRPIPRPESNEFKLDHINGDEDRLRYFKY